ncbi:MAG: flavocytochrome c [Thermodesulfobacteriota bacterium]
MAFSERDWDEITDVIVVGSGFAGLAAAIEAQMAGARVVVLEKMPVPGGNSRISDGALCAPGNFLQRAHNVEDSPQRFYEDILRAGRTRNHPRLVRVLAEQAAAAVDWTRDFLGVPYKDRLDRFGGHSAARGVTFACHSGLDCIRAMVVKFEELGGVLRTSCRLDALLAGQEHRIGGVGVREGFSHTRGESGVSKRIGANKAVILATGGFGNDIFFRTMQDPQLGEEIASTNHKGATADGLRAALGIGAVPVQLAHIQLGPWGCPDEKGYGTAARFASYSVFPTGILVDPETGQRFVNEWGDRKVRTDAILALGHPALGIVDAQGAQMDTNSLRHGVQTGKIQSYDSLEELAAAHSVPEAALAATIEQYHAAIERGGEDAFGKPLTPETAKLVTPPFAAVRLWPKVHHTMGGIGIDEQARVLDTSGRIVSRLYAAGEVCGGVHGESRLGGCALTECIVFGRIAGRNAVGA